ncbi:MAG: flavodoxin family protein [Candidatus Hydrogenedentes bacterium]|nr:flavodoxin family protein [Candidatus Hydrogenedentota bacterium]
MLVNKKVTAVIGTYRKGGTTDSVVNEILDAAEENGAEINRIYLIDKRIEFCTNCRTCTQTEGSARGVCVHNDDMNDILDEIDCADALVFAAPVNVFNVTAVMRRFMERLICYSYWPWGKHGGPSFRLAGGRRPAVLVTSSAMPGSMARLFTGALRALRVTAKTVGAKPVTSIVVGLAASNEMQPLPEKIVRKSRRIGAWLAS